jgi:hypothetical protein
MLICRALYDLIKTAPQHPTFQIPPHGGRAPHLAMRLCARSAASGFDLHIVSFFASRRSVLDQRELMYAWVQWLGMLPWQDTGTVTFSSSRVVDHALEFGGNARSDLMRRRGRDLAQ